MYVLYCLWNLPHDCGSIDASRRERVEDDTLIKIRNASMVGRVSLETGSVCMAEESL